MPVVSLLRLKDIAKNFGAKGIDLEIAPGEVVGLMGDNGAGKSTLVKIIAGNFPQSAGTIEMEGKVVDFHRPIDARQVGIEVVYQDLAIADNLTAADNVFLGRELKKGWWPFETLDARATSCARCRAASARRWRSPAPASSRPSSC
jgi:simple sugar transport system ATP-binding protein